MGFNHKSKSEVCIVWPVAGRELEGQKLEKRYSYSWDQLWPPCRPQCIVLDPLLEEVANFKFIFVSHFTTNFWNVGAVIMLNFLKHPNFFNSFNVTRPCISFVLHSDENTSQVHCTSVVFLESGIRNQASLGESNVFGSIQNVLKCVKMKCRYVMIEDTKVQPVM